ncbi:hypothetical protein BD779DRAFT_1435788 [Infundibulicybe gibba]|nr:hypothetical protein BD779DRAFT_1435788 [Infundibulicybe gibba]
MLILNPTWEQEVIPEALGKLRNNLEVCGSHETSSRPCIPERPLEERKLDYVHLSNGNKSQSQTSVNKSISAFLARNRAKNDESNRAEFLHAVNTGTETPKNSKFSCARTDAKHLDRDIQMKYDIAKNEEGPLRRTMKSTERPVSDKPPGSAAEGKPSLQGDDDGLISERHPGLNQRLANIEAHLAVHYVPSPPRTLLTRLKFLEDHLIMLEKEYPPWAALHFNQPNRGWPPPPRSTPVIVPAQLRSGTNASSPLPQGNPPEMLPTTAGGPKLRNTASSLHRAILERLEVQQAINDLASGGSK